MNKISWSRKQQRRLAVLLRAEASDPENTWIGYWTSDQHGRPCNGGSGDPVTAGLIQHVPGPLRICGSRALHATRAPHQWRGHRVWVVALLGNRQNKGDKSGALSREIIGEILPRECLDPQIFVRVSFNLSHADLSYADLYGANLSGADLIRADLRGANLRGAYLSRANLGYANLSYADLSGADLSGAYLSRAYLSGAYLSRADLRGANLGGANLSYADLSRAYLSRADLSRANLSYADLSRAYLSYADLSRANLSGAIVGDSPAPAGWVSVNGILRRAGE